MISNNTMITVRIQIQIEQQARFENNFTINANSTFKDVIIHCKSILPKLNQYIAPNLANVSLRCKHCDDFVRNCKQIIQDHSQDNILDILLIIVEATNQIREKIRTPQSKGKNGIDPNSLISLRVTLDIQNNPSCLFQKFCSAASSYNDVSQQIMNRFQKSNTIEKEQKEITSTVYSNGNIINKKTSFNKLNIIDGITKEANLTIHFYLPGG